MAGVASKIVDEVSPTEAMQCLRDDPDAVLIDVRTRAEWAFTGLPDLREVGRAVVPVEWVQFPTMTPNPGSMEQLQGAVGDPLPAHLLFLCRSGARSMAAAQLVAAEGKAGAGGLRCSNVAEGFEGDLDANGHRGRVNGWKVDGLPCRQN